MSAKPAPSIATQPRRPRRRAQAGEIGAEGLAPIRFVVLPALASDAWRVKRAEEILRAALLKHPELLEEAR